MNEVYKLKDGKIKILNGDIYIRNKLWIIYFPQYLISRTVLTLVNFLKTQIGYIDYNDVNRDFL